MDDIAELLELGLKIKHLAWYLVAAAVALLIIFGVIWWNFVYENPYNVYWGMLSNSLSTSSVTKHVTQKSGGTSLDQYIAFNYGTQNFAYGRTTLKDPVSTVKTESLGTMTNDYIRYTSIKTSQKSKAGKDLTFSKVLGTWAKADAHNSADQQGSAPFFIQSVFGLSGGNTVPMVYLNQQQRDDLLSMLHKTDIYDASFNNVKKKVVNGTMLYTYDVTVQPVGYVAFEKALANDLGVKTYSTVDPNQYINQDPVKFKFVVDAHSHRLQSIIFANADHTETYSAYGIPVRQPIPKQTVSDQKLQELLTNVE